MWVGCLGYAQANLLPGKRAVSHYTGSWVGPRISLDGCGKSRPTGFRSPGRLSRSQSLHSLRCPGPLHLILGLQNCPLSWDSQRITLNWYFMFCMRATGSTHHTVYCNDTSQRLNTMNTLPNELLSILVWPSAQNFLTLLRRIVSRQLRSLFLFSQDSKQSKSNR